MPKKTSRGGTQPGNRRRAKKPTIMVLNSNETIQSAVDALKKEFPGQLYDRGGTLVREVHLRVPGEGIRPELHKVSKEGSMELLREAANWAKESPFRNSGPSPTSPPGWVSETIRKDPTGRFPRLTAAVCAPTLLLGGQLLAQPGYDSASGVLFMDDGTIWPQVPALPTLEDAHRSLQALLEVYVDFPFQEECDRSAAIAAVLTAVARPAIKGPVPAFRIGATSAGSGKGLLAETISIIATGASAPVTSWPKGEEELRKVLHTHAIEARPMVVFDNITKPLDSGPLAAVLTATRWTDRVMGGNSGSDLRLQTIYFVTGNNIEVVGDLSRRFIPIDLASTEEFPEQRSGFVHEELPEWTLINRPRLVAAALTLLRWYEAAGRPSPMGLRPFGSYMPWSRLVRAALVALGMVDPVLGNRRLREHHDPEREGIQRLLTVWHEVLGERVVTAGQLMEEAQKRRDPDLMTAMMALVPGRKPNEDLAVRIAKVLRKFTGRNVGGLGLQRPAQKVHGQWTYQVLPVIPGLDIPDMPPEAPGASGSCDSAPEETEGGGGGLACGLSACALSIHCTNNVVPSQE